PSSGVTGSMPENSSTSMAMTPLAASVTLIELTTALLGAYHISPRPLTPAVKYAPTIDQLLPAESVIDAIGLFAPVKTLAQSTSRLPADVAMATSSVGLPPVSVAPATCRNCGTMVVVGI